MLQHTCIEEQATGLFGSKVQHDLVLVADHNVPFVGQVVRNVLGAQKCRIRWNFL